MPGIFMSLSADEHSSAIRQSSERGLVAVRTRVISNAAEPSAKRRELHGLLSDTHIPADPKGGEHRKFLPWENLSSSFRK